MTHDSSTLPLTVDNTGFLLDKLGEDCHPLQFLRELTQNAIEAIQRTPDRRGEIVWDVDWTAYEFNPSTYKLCIVDNGVGMSGDEMVRYINQLSSSGAVQAYDGNYGVGAKIAAATRNHGGLIYLSWKDGQGAMIHLWRDPETGQYGLRQVESPSGEFRHFGIVGDDIKPELINRHGTKIILYGNSDDEDTMRAPPEAASSSRWIAKYLNTRYFRIPDGIRIRSREGWERPRSNTKLNTLRTVVGQEAYLRVHAVAAGRVPLTGATAHWWVLKDEPAVTSNTGYIESSGHCAALYQDELYELFGGRAGHARLQQFGVIFGQRQVAIYVEPAAGADVRITTNTARTHLLADSEPLPWTDWAVEFRQQMPREIDHLMQRIAAQASSSDHLAAVRERLRPVINLFKMSRYQPSGPEPPRPLAISKRIKRSNVSTNPTTAADASTNGEPEPDQEPPAKPKSSAGGVYASFLQRGSRSESPLAKDLFPEVRWVSVADGTRDPGDIEDKAARYLPDQNLLLINADFRVFTDMIRHWESLYAEQQSDSAGVREYIGDSVHDWYEQALTESVIGVKGLDGSREWSIKDIEHALSEEALTAVVMQRYHPYNSVKRQLAMRIGSLKGK